MTRINEVLLTNGGMRINIISTIGDKALLARKNDNSFIVADGLNIKEDLTCEWAFAYGYFERYEDAYKLYTENIVKKFLEYGEE